jgi:hypothetical protein
MIRSEIKLFYRTESDLIWNKKIAAAAEPGFLVPLLRDLFNLKDHIKKE